MPELPELFKGAVGDVPPFEPAALAARARRHRRRQVGASTASAALVVVLVIAVFNVGRSDSHDDVALQTRGSSSTVATETSTTTEPLTTSASTNVLRTHPTDAPATSTSTSTPPPTLPVSAAAISPGADDFTGTLTAGATTMRVGDSSDIRWSIRNITDHAIEPFYLGIFADRNPAPATTSDIAAICAPLTADGQPAIRLTLATRRNIFMPAYNTYVQPGADLTTTGRYEATADDVGTVTCEVVILDLSNGYTDIRVLARVGAIPAVTITVLPDDDPTTSTSTTSTTTSTPPTT